MNATSKAPAYCHARLPNAGLGNKLLVWGRAHLFARLNHLPLVVNGWIRPQFTPWMRGGDFRFYWNYFDPTREVGIIRRWTTFRFARVVREPVVSVIEPPRVPTIFEFTEIPHWADYFRDLKPHRDEIRAALVDFLTPARRREVENAPKPPVCLQVRMADFRPLNEGEDFKQVGGVRTPLAYFIDLIQGIREIRGEQVPIMIVSDGQRQQLHELLAVPGVELGPKQTAIADILMMSASKIVVPSAGSTFGDWGGFLGDNALLMHPDHIHEPIRPAHTNARFYEGSAVGPACQWPELLQQNICAI